MTLVLKSMGWNIQIYVTYFEIHQKKKKKEKKKEMMQFLLRRSGNKYD